MNASQWKISGLAVLVSGMLAATWLTGCRTVVKMPVEDTKVLEVYAPEIAVLHNPDLDSRSQEKFMAAKKLAEELDFTYIRKVETLDAIFSGYNARLSSPTLNDEQDIYFYYQYGDSSVRFIFHRIGTLITHQQIDVTEP